MSDPKGLALALLQYGRQIDEIKNKYALQVGKVAVASNELHFKFFICFSHLLRLDLDTAKSLWECGKGGDKAQRNMLRSILDLIKRKKDRQALEEILSMVDKLGDYRNSLMHSMVEMDYELMELKVNEKSIQIGHVNRLKSIMKNNQFDDIESDLKELTLFMFFMNPRFAGETRTTLLKKPPLKVLSWPSEEARPKTRTGKVARRQRQHQASRQKPK